MITTTKRRTIKRRTERRKAANRMSLRNLKILQDKKPKETRSKIQIFWEDYLKGEQGEILDMEAVLR